MNGPQAIPVTLAGVAAMGITKNTAMYTDPIDISGLDEFALSIILAGTGSVSCKVQLEQGMVLPAGNSSDAAFSVPTGISDIIANLAVKTIVHIALSPVCVRYIRFIITELTNSSTDTVATASVSAMNRFRST